MNGSRPWTQLLALSLVGALAPGCDEQGDGSGACGGRDCDLPLQREHLLDALQGHADPVAAWMRRAADEQAVVAADWQSVVTGMTEELGCSNDEQRAFVVQSNLDLAPKAVLTHCSEDAQRASSVLTIFEPTSAGDDLDPRTLRMAAWDADAGVYRRYQLAPHPAGGLGVDVEPAFCEGCHAGAVGSAAWTPIMNEMTNPWAQWNAEPGFSSFAFDPARVERAAGPTYQDITAERLDSASNLEPIVRAAIDRVVAAEITSRQSSPDLQTAADLLRPVFCDGSVNYVSEVHGGGEIRSSAVIDPGIRRALQAQDPTGWPWSWVYDDTLRIDPVGEGESALVLMTVRAEASIQAEAALLSRGVLEPIDVLRVRALEWMQPVGATLRCDLFDAGLERARSGAIDPTEASDNAGLVRALYEETMQVHSDRGVVSLVLPQDDQLVAVADAGQGRAVRAGQIESYVVSIEAWGQAIESHLEALGQKEGRTTLEAERVERGCWARATFPTAPIIPGTQSCS